MPKTKPVVIERDPTEPMPKRLLDKEIAALARAAMSLLGSGLDRKDLIALIRRRAPNVGPIAVREVLEAIEDLGIKYAVKP